MAAVPERGTSPDGAERDESVLDEVEERLGFRAFFAKHPALDLTYRIVVGLLGGAIVVLGIILIPLPGPGWLIVFAGLALLATEFVWAERLLRGLIGLGGLLCVAGAIWAYDVVVGLPSWVPVL